MTDEQRRSGHEDEERQAGDEGEEPQAPRWTFLVFILILVAVLLGAEAVLERLMPLR